MMNLWDCVIYRCVVGSRAYGLDESDSDTDRRGIYLPPADAYWSLEGVPEQLENEATQECYWEIQKFVTLALKANPNLLECLYTPLVEHATPLAQELVAMRDAFLSQKLYHTYQGYVAGQMKLLERDLRTRGQIRWKHAMHLIRLLIAGTYAMREGIIDIQVGQHRDALLAIRRGEMTWEKIAAWQSQLHVEFEAAYTTTRLPAEPDVARVNAFLIKARRSAL